MKEVANIRIGFENCDTMDFNAKEIAALLLDNITTCVQRVACNSIVEMTQCTDFFIELIPAANREHAPFGMDGEAYKTTNFRRIREFDDITSVEVFYDDGTSVDIYVPWEGVTDSGEINKLQSSYLSENGALYIYISKDKSNVREMLDFEEINSPDYAQHLDPEWFM